MASGAWPTSRARTSRCCSAPPSSSSWARVPWPSTPCSRADGEVQPGDRTDAGDPLSEQAAVSDAGDAAVEADLLVGPAGGGVARIPSRGHGGGAGALAPHEVERELIHRRADAAARMRG